jgi:hypothetical protein
MTNDIQRRILAEAIKYGGTNISVPEQMAKMINEAPVLTGGEAAPTLFGWGKHQFEAKFRELLMRMGFERGIIHMKTEGQEMKMYFANAAKARDFVVSFNGLARRKSMGSVASVATQFNKIKVPTGTNAIVSLDLTMIRGESLDIEGTDLYEWFIGKEPLNEGGVKAAIEDFMYSLPKEAIAELKPLMKKKGGVAQQVMRLASITAILNKHGVAKKLMGYNTANLVSDYFNTFHGESVEVEEANEKYLTGPGKKDPKRLVGIYSSTGKWIKDMGSEAEARKFVNKSWGESVEEAQDFLLELSADDPDIEKADRDLRERERSQISQFIRNMPKNAVREIRKHCHVHGSSYSGDYTRPANKLKAINSILKKYGIPQEVVLDPKFPRIKDRVDTLVYDHLDRVRPATFRVMGGAETMIRNDIANGAVSMSGSNWQSVFDEPNHAHSGDFIVLTKNYKNKYSPRETISVDWKTEEMLARELRRLPNAKMPEIKLGAKTTWSAPSSVGGGGEMTIIAIKEQVEITEEVEVSEQFKAGDKVKVPHKGKMVSGKIVKVYRTERAARKHAMTGKPVDEEVEVNESVKPKLITPKEMTDYKVKKVLAVGTKPNNESIVATCDWGGKKFVQLEKMGRTSGIDQIVQATFFGTEKEAMDEMRDRGFEIHA